MIEMSFLAVGFLLTTAAPFWIDEAQADWEKTFQHRPTFVTVRSLSTFPNRIEHVEYRLQRHGDDMLYYERRPKSRTKKEGPQQDDIRRLVLNDHYAFIVRKMAADSEWMLDSFGKPGDDVYNYVKRHIWIMRRNRWRGPSADKR